MIYNTNFGNAWKKNYMNFNNNYNNENYFNNIESNNQMHLRYQRKHQQCENNYYQQQYNYYNNNYYSNFQNGISHVGVINNFQSNQYSNNYLSRARCSTVKQLLDTSHGVKSITSASLMQPTIQQEPNLIVLGQISPQIAEINPVIITVPQTACHHQKPETSLDWEEQFVDLTSYCNSHTPMALIPDEEFVTNSQATEQRNGPDVFFGNESIGSGLEMMLDNSSYDLLYKESNDEIIEHENNNSNNSGVHSNENISNVGIGVASDVCEGNIINGGLKLNVDNINDTTDLLNTPDVIKAFDDVESFDLIEYVFNEDKKPNLFELDKQQNNDEQNQSQSQHLHEDHQYTSTTNNNNNTSISLQQISTETTTSKTLSLLQTSNKHNLINNNNDKHINNNKNNIKHHGKNYDKLYNNNKNNNNKLLKLNNKTNNINKPKQIATIRPKRIKQKKILTDFIYENITSPIEIKKENNLIDDDINDVNKDIEINLINSIQLNNIINNDLIYKSDKKLHTINKRKRNISNCSTSTGGSIGSISNSESHNSKTYNHNEDIEDLLEYESGKYRELRCRNNEASRRSRANRKQRELKMKQYSEKLIQDNIQLKTKSQYLENQVEKFRNLLMKIVLSKQKK